MRKTASCEGAWWATRLTVSPFIHSRGRKAARHEQEEAVVRLSVAAVRRVRPVLAVLAVRRGAAAACLAAHATHDGLLRVRGRGRG